MQSASEQVIPATPENSAMLDAFYGAVPDFHTTFDDGRTASVAASNPLSSADRKWLAGIHAAHAVLTKPPSPAPMVEQAGEVIQADRDAAASLFHMIIGGVGGAKKMRAGEIDHHSVVQAFARHRLNTRPAPAETEGVGRDEIVAEVVELARRDMARTQTDFVGRMQQSMCEFERVCDEYPDGEWPDDEREVADEALAGLTGLALAQLAILRGEALVSVSTPPADAGMLREAIRCLMPYLDWMLGPESPGYHPTMPSAVAAVKAALQTNAAAALNSQAHQIREGDHG